MNRPSSTQEVPAHGDVPRHVAEIDRLLQEKEKELMAV